MKKSLAFTLLGFSLGLGAPLGILALRFFRLSHSISLLEHISQEWESFPYFYWYMLISTSLMFAVFGFFLGRKADRLIQKDEVLTQEVLTDPLTGLGNHRFLHEAFQVEFRKHVASRKPISCLMMDLDHFKRINDAHGHPFGDFVLHHFAALVKKSIRAGDVATRYGGEEFLCILPNCDQEEARRVAERIRLETENYPFRRGDISARLTVSIGSVTSYESSGLNYRQLIALSDQALYEAKRKGRNRLVQAFLGAKKNKGPERAA